MNKLTDVRFNFIQSGEPNLKEVSVTFALDDKYYHYFVFTKMKDGWNDKDYIKEAKKQFYADFKAGKVMKMCKTTHGRKSHLVVATSILGVAAVAFAGLFTWKYLISGNIGGTYQPGQAVDVKPAVEDPSGGNYIVTFSNDKAKVGEKYHTSINLTPKNPTNDDYVLPDKLVSVISNTTALKEEQYKYTLAENKTTAELEVEGEFVYGPVTVSLVLVSTSQPGPGPKPGPVVWQTATEQEVNEIRLNAIAYQTMKSPLKVLEEVVGGTQFKITDTRELLFPNLPPNEGTVNDVTLIDSNQMYIEKDDQNETTDDDEFCTYHVDESNPESTGVYRCFYQDIELKDKKNELLYPSASINQAVEKFTPAMGVYTVEDWAGDIYGREQMKYGANTAFVVLDDYYYDLQERFYVHKDELPEITFEKGNDLSFKLTANKSIHFYLEEAEDYIDVDTNFEFRVENGVLVNFVEHMVLSMQGVQLYVMNNTTKLETASFTPKDLSEYFTE